MVTRSDVEIKNLGYPFMAKMQLQSDPFVEKAYNPGKFLKIWESNKVNSLLLMK
jgi:hypothetical protein